MNHRSPDHQHAAGLAADSHDGGSPRVTGPVADGQYRMDNLAAEFQLRRWIDSGDAKKWREASYPHRARAARLLGVSDKQLGRWESGAVFPNFGNARRLYAFCEDNRRRYNEMNREEQPCPPQPPE